MCMKYADNFLNINICIELDLVTVMYVHSLVYISTHFITLWQLFSSWVEVGDSALQIIFISFGFGVTTSKG